MLVAVFVGIEVIVLILVGVCVIVGNGVLMAVLVKVMVTEGV